MPVAGSCPDLLHVHCFGPERGIRALASIAVSELPLVVTSHGETVADDNAVFERSSVLRMALRRSLATAAAVTAPSEFVIADLRTRYGLPDGEVVPNGVDPRCDPGDPDARAPPRQARYLLGVGRLGRMKGFDLLVGAFAGSVLAPASGWS